MISKDGQWRVRVISLNGMPLIRVETTRPVTGEEPGKIVETDPGWYIMAHCTTPGAVEAFVPMSELEEEEEGTEHAEPGTPSELALGS